MEGRTDRGAKHTLSAQPFPGELQPITIPAWLPKAQHTNTYKGSYSDPRPVLKGSFNLTRELLNCPQSCCL